MTKSREQLGQKLEIDICGKIYRCIAGVKATTRRSVQYTQMTLALGVCVCVGVLCGVHYSGAASNVECGPPGARATERSIYTHPHIRRHGISTHVSYTLGEKFWSMKEREKEREESRELLHFFLSLSLSPSRLVSESRRRFYTFFVIIL